MAFARATTNARINIPLIGFSLGMYTFVVSPAITGGAAENLPSVLVGAFLATGGAMLGAAIAKTYTRLALAGTPVSGGS